KQDDVAIDFAWEIQQADIEIFDLHANGGNLIHGIFHPLKSLLALGLASREMNDVDRHPAVHENPMSDPLQLGVNRFNQLFAVKSFAQKRFEDWQQILCFAESESAGRHGYVPIVASTPLPVVGRRRSSLVVRPCSLASICHIRQERKRQYAL